MQAIIYRMASLVAQKVKNLPAMQKAWVQSLGWEDSMEKEMATHSGILAWEIPWTDNPGGLQCMGTHRVRHDLATKQKQCKERRTSRLYIVILLI